MRKQSILQVLIAAGILAGLLMMQGCASLSYETQDGTKVTYTRLLTSADSVKGAVPGASVEFANQRTDAETLRALLNLLAGVK
jgi:hypothetical protein